MGQKRIKSGSEGGGSGLKILLRKRAHLMKILRKKRGVLKENERENQKNGIAGNFGFDAGRRSL